MSIGHRAGYPAAMRAPHFAVPGLLLALLAAACGDVSIAFRARGLLSAVASDNVVRLIPPLIVEPAQIAEAVGMIEAACEDLRKAAKEKAPEAAKAG